MSGSHFYLLTLLPSLPELGIQFDDFDAVSKIREEGSEKAQMLADLLELEGRINECALQHYVLGNKNWTTELSSRIPESFCELFNSYHEADESEWMTGIFAAWFELIIELGRKTGSELLIKWAEWEYGLRTALRADRLQKAGASPSDGSLVPESMSRCGVSVSDYQQYVDMYRAIPDAMEAEKALDRARIDYLHSFAADYTFTDDELAAYMLELRIHQRYLHLNPETGRKTLEEVTKL